MSDPKMWKRLCGQAVELCGGQETFRGEARILQRLVQKFGAPEVEHMIAGATMLGWRSLKSLGSKDGLGRRWAIEKYWQTQNAQKRVGKVPERLKAILWEVATRD